MMANDGAWSVKHWPWLIHKSMTRLFMIPLPIIGSWYIVGYDWWILDKDGGQIEMIVSGKCATRFSTEVSAQSRPATSLLRSSPNNATRAPQAGSRGVLEFVSQRLWMERQRRILAAKCWKRGLKAPWLSDVAWCLTSEKKKCKSCQHEITIWLRVMTNVKTMLATPHSAPYDLVQGPHKERKCSPAVHVNKAVHLPGVSDIVLVTDRSITARHRWQGPSDHQLLQRTFSRSISGYEGMDS